MKEQPKPERGGWGNMKQSSYEDIQATGDLPRACHLDVGVTSHLEGTMQAPALDGKHSLKRVQAAVQGRLAVHGLELGQASCRVRRACLDSKIKGVPSF